MHKSINRLLSIEKEIQLEKSNSKKTFLPNIIAVSKTFPISEILPLINHGHIHFGENKVQEANEKWTDILNDFKHLKLHMIGKLQTNKVKKLQKVMWRLGKLICLLNMFKPKNIKGIINICSIGSSHTKVYLG